MEYLKARYDSRKSFFNKAVIIRHPTLEIELWSYNTLVSVSRGGKVERLGKWSQTTTRHQNEFEKQIINGDIK